MKIKKLFICLIFAMLFVGVGLRLPLFANAQSDGVEVLQTGDERLTNRYLNFYGVDSSYFSYSNNGGELGGNELAKAFDRDETTSFKSAQDNNVNYQGEDGQTLSNFQNHIDVVFNGDVKIDRIMYGSETSLTRGYPKELNIYTSTDGENFTLFKSFSSNSTSQMVIFNLGQKISVRGIRFEYVSVERAHKYVATAREIIFLQEENSFYEDYCNLFSSYNQTSLSRKYSLEEIDSFEGGITANLDYVSPYITKTFQRAREVVRGDVTFDETREFSTNSKHANRIYQHGDVTNYARNTMKMAFFGTDRQVTGIASREGEVITIYVDGEEGDPLPQLYFSQTENYYNGWLSGKTLTLGENTFVTPNLKNSNYTREVVTGGALYIVNPYTSQEQSQGVKVYIEGGYTFPVYKKGGNEREYKKALEEYYQMVEGEKDKYFDLTELVCDHLILTLTARGGYDYYINKSYSPEEALCGWDEYMEMLLEFGGVTFDKSDDLYEPIHEYLNTNIRIVQSYAGSAAYAFYEHVGIYKSWESTALIGSGFGWGFAHELGHMFDNMSDRLVSECSNNMWAKYSETAIEKKAVRGEFDKTLLALCDGDDETYFNSNRLNFLVWWYIETYHNGYWGDLENCYRGRNKTLLRFLSLDEEYESRLKNLSSTEKQIFYSSLVVGIDLSYYFQRWGFTLSTSQDPFNSANASEDYLYLISEGVRRGYIDSTKKPKLWLQDAGQYNILQETKKALFNGKNKVEIKDVLKNSNGYTILFDRIDDDRFLGYEILREDEDGGYSVIAFSNSNVYFDDTSLNNPKYKILGYDRLYNTSRLSEGKGYVENSKNVCRIGEEYYSSLKECVENAESGDEIILLDDCNSQNIVIDKDLTIKLEENGKSVKISRVEGGDMFVIQSGVKLILKGNEGGNIIFDGNSFSQNGSIFAVTGVLEGEYITLQNNHSSGNGGGIRMLTANKNLPSTIKNLLIQNNIASNGGGIFSDNANNSLTLEGVEFIGNSSENGGGIFNKGTITLNNCIFEKNTSSDKGTLYNYSGGVIYVNDCQFYKNSAKFGGGLWVDGYTQINGGRIYQNTAQEGGGIYALAGNSGRKLILNEAQITKNKTNDIYFAGIIMEATSSTIGSLSIQNGSVNIEKSCLISNILLGEGSIVLKNGVFALDKCLIEVENPVEGGVVLNAEGFTLTQEDVERARIKGRYKLILLDDKGVLKALPYDYTWIIVLSSIIGGGAIIFAVMFIYKKKKYKK